MKNLLRACTLITVLIFILCSISLQAQTSSYIKIEYDSFGNRIKRQKIMTRSSSFDSEVKIEDNLYSKKTQKIQSKNNLTIESNNKEEFSIFPNPVQDNLVINYEGIADNSFFQIIDFNGKVLIEDQLNNFSTTLNISHLSTGVYIVKLFNVDKIQYREIFKL